MGRDYMKRHFLLISIIAITAYGLVSCSSNQDLNQEASDLTVEDNVSEQKSQLSRDDAEVLIYHLLTIEEQQKYTVDFVKEEQSLYYIRVYENDQGQIQVKRKYTVNSHTKEIKQIE